MAYIESVIIKDSGGTEADVTAANALKVDGSAVTQPVNVVAGSVTASVDLQQDVFGQLVIANRYNQFEINYDSTDPDSISEITVTKTNGGDASNSAGQAVFTSNANTNGGVKAVTNLTVTYRPNAETYAAFTAIWPSGGLANSYQRIGIYDANNGFYIGYEGTSFGITLRKGAVDTFTAQASWNIDTLTGGVGSKYTRNGTPEAIDFSKDNLFRVRYGWLGAAPIYWEVLSPDGEWVLFDIYRHPNTTAGTTINNPDLPLTLDIQKTAAGATVLTMNTACWAAGTTSPYTKISSTITDNTLANMSRSVITGRASTGGGTYYNVKVTPSGSLVTAGQDIYPEDSAHASGNDGSFVLAVRNDSNATMTSADGDYSPIAVNANGAVAINDGGNSITVDGSVTSTISGTVSVDIVTDSVGLATEATLLQVDTDVQAVQNQIKIMQYGEDVASSDGDTGVFVLAIRNDANAVVTSNDGDYSQISVNSKGAVAINDGGNSITVDGTVTLGANSGVDIGDVDVTSVVPGTGATNLGKEEDSKHNSGDVGVFALGVRNDSNAVITSADGDYSQISVNDKGAVAIQDGGNSITVDGTVAFSNTTIAVTQATAANLNATVTGTVATGTEYAEDTAHSTGAKGNFILAVRNDTDSAVTNADGDYSPISVNSKGAIAIQDGGNTITVDGTVTANAGTGNFTVIQGTATNLKTQAEVYQGGTAVGAANPLQVSLANTGTNATAININDTSTDLTASISISALSGTSGSITTLNGQGTYVFQLTGTWTATLQVQITVDGTNWVNITDSLAINSHTTGTFATSGNITANGIYQVDCSGLSGIRLIATAFSSGPITGTARASRSDALTAIEGIATIKSITDTGRKNLRYYAVAAAAGTTGTQTAITLTESSGTSATTTGTSFTPTAGKTFRITAITFATRGNATATAQTTTFNFRINTAGAVTTTSTPIILSMRSATPATANAWDRVMVEIPDGLEIPGDGTLQWGITAAATYTTNAPTWDVTVIGFEY